MVCCVGIPLSRGEDWKVPFDCVWQCSDAIYLIVLLEGWGEVGCIFVKIEKYSQKNYKERLGMAETGSWYSVYNHFFLYFVVIIGFYRKGSDKGRADACGI